jgi:hypothetical protein
MKKSANFGLQKSECLAGNRQPSHQRYRKLLMTTPDTLKKQLRRTGTRVESLKGLTFLGFLLGALLLPSRPLMAGDEVPGLEVKAAVFTNAIDQKNFVEPGMQSGLHIQHGPIYFWTVLSGTEESLKVLRNKAKAFPIWHRWTYVGAFGSSPDIAEVTDRDAEAIPIGSIHHWPALLSEIGSFGRFDWRTWSGKRHLRIGEYRVTVMCGKNTPLKCNGNECTYYFDYFP